MTSTSKFHNDPRINTSRWFTMVRLAKCFTIP
eukprot:CAMPEP_0171622820 /NCGR_PEP_ID=MMETSP0990-20121206/17516_1 /TAXON_ID=483369 /ORGANISM="non described non described, Strain CCMP2098" /LENGTH=31 /DNA_ID= /DNA_START= /DNA_END= /DNA_ORIENTATION=